MNRANRSMPAATRRVGRTAALLVVAAVLAALASCGVESGDDVASTGAADTSSASTTTEADGTTTTEGSGETDDPEDTTTTSEAGDEPASTTAPELGSEDEMVRDALIQGFESAGFTTEQATCLADGYIDMGITDPEASADLDIMAMMDLFSQCGVSMEDLGQIGGELGV